MALIDSFSGVNGLFYIGLRILGWLLVIGLYALIGTHVYAFFHLIATVLKRRLGTYFGILWCAIGICLLYNITFNHFMAMMIKPGGPDDLEKIEKMRMELKNRQHRKEVNVALDDN